MKSRLLAAALFALLVFTVRVDAQCFIVTTSVQQSPCTYLFVASGNMATSYVWDFGDASTGTGNSTAHTYAGNGTFNVCCVGFDISGSPCDTSCITVSVSGCSSSASCLVVGTQISNGPCSFTFVASGTAVAYGWDFGDSQTGTGPTVQHTYSSNGNYNVCVVGYDTTGMPCDTFCMTAVVTNCTPASCTIVGTLIPNGPCTYTFIASGATSYSWDFGDSQSGTGTTVQHTYSGNGTYTVCVVGYDAQSLPCDTFCMTATISNCTSSSCTVITTSTSLNPCTVQFAATGIGASTYVWNFGDSQSGTGTAPQHVYTSNGTYTVCCVGMDANGTPCDTSCSVVTITGCVSGIEENNTVEIALYPNPVNEQLTVKCDGAAVSGWMITDLAGREVSEGSVISNAFTIATSALTEGVYFLIVYGNENNIAAVRHVVVSR